MSKDQLNEQIRQHLPALHQDSAIWDVRATPSGLVVHLLPRHCGLESCASCRQLVAYAAPMPYTAASRIAESFSRLGTIDEQGARS